MKFYEGGFYDIGTVQKNRKGMQRMPVDRKIKRDDFGHLYSDKVFCCNWLDRSLVTMLLSNVEGMATTSTFPHQQKRSTSKIQVPCHDVIKMYNKGMSGVDLNDQRVAFYLNQK